MSTELEPIIGRWYRHLDKGQPFVVVSYEEVEGLVGIQHYDGDVEELEIEDWFGMDIETAEAPEDWTAPIDDVEADDLDYTDTDMTARDWSSPLQESQPDAKERWEDPYPEGDGAKGAEGTASEKLHGDEEP
jgi:hypothetical protein